MRHPYLQAVAMLLAVGVVAPVPAAQARKGKAPSSSMATQRAMAMARALLPKKGGGSVALVGHVTPAAPVDGPQGYRLGLQIGRGPDPVTAGDGDLRWDSANDRLTVSKNNRLDGNLYLGPYAGLLFTMRADKRYIVMCNGNGTSAHIVWTLGVSPTTLNQSGNTDMRGGSFVFMTDAISGPGGYADLRFGFDTATELSECWMFSYDATAARLPPLPAPN